MQIQRLTERRGPVCTAILRDLPEWFGIAASIEAYARDAERLTTYAADEAGERVGIISLAPRGSTTLEIHVMAVRRAWHGQGVGTALPARAERDARDGGYSTLLVKR